MPTTLVRYAGKRALAAAPYMPYAKRARLAYAVGSHLYHNRRKYAKAAKTIGRAYRRFKKRQRREIGHRVGSSTAKRYDNLTASVLNQNERTLLATEMTFPIIGDAIDNRERKMINLRGMKVCAEYKGMANIPSATGVYCNVALLFDKTNPTSSTFLGEKLFRANGTERGRDFSSLERSIDFHCAPINTDRYGVLMHKRFRINNTSQPDMNGGKVVQTVMKYVPIKRQIRFTGEVPDTRIFFVRWFALDSLHTATPTAGSMVRESYHNIWYFRDPKP